MLLKSVEKCFVNTVVVDYIFQNKKKKVNYQLYLIKIFFVLGGQRVKIW